ncbi:MAG: hypothetical protein K5643_03315 [Saccharofermentans sp.]|nr:hypothetical protein [Saccharofermentans sp.]
MYSIHPYEPFIPQGADKLIIGTTPPYRFCVEPHELYDGDVDFYYGSRSNGFWSLIGEATGETFDHENTEKAIAQRKDFLAKRGMGITDIVGRCIHNNGNSDDGSLKDITPKPIGELLANHPGINTLIYTGRSGGINSVMNLMNRYTADKHRHSKTDLPEEKRVTIGGRDYRVILLYSPSPNALRSVSKETRLEQYKRVFGK